MLSVDEFDAFHVAVHGADKHAFGWQTRLLRQIVANREWPRVLDLPTGAGKTTCIDIALFALALDAQEATEKRWCPRRLAMVVDRRVVVDQVAERGRKLLRALVDREAKPVVRKVADRLCSLSKEAKEDIARHRAISVAHEAAAKCLEAGKKDEVCETELQRACKGLAIGKFCGMKHQH